MCDEITDSDLETATDAARALASGIRRKRPDGWAVHWGRRRVRVLEFTLANVYRPDWHEMTEDYRTERYRPLRDKMAAGLPPSGQWRQFASHSGSGAHMQRHSGPLHLRHWTSRLPGWSIITRYHDHPCPPVLRGCNRQSAAAVGARFWRRQERGWQRRTSTHSEHRNCQKGRRSGLGSTMGHCECLWGKEKWNGAM